MQRQRVTTENLEQYAPQSLDLWRWPFSGEIFLVETMGIIVKMLARLCCLDTGLLVQSCVVDGFSLLGVMGMAWGSDVCATSLWRPLRLKRNKKQDFELVVNYLDRCRSWGHISVLLALWFWQGATWLECYLVLYCFVHTGLYMHTRYV